MKKEKEVVFDIRIWETADGKFAPMLSGGATIVTAAFSSEADADAAAILLADFLDSQDIPFVLDLKCSNKKK